MATQSEVKYNRLMEKAEVLFVTLGYKAVSMDQIAEAAGIGKMTIYRHFSSKEELFIEVLWRLMDRHYFLINAELKNITGTLEKINYLLNYSIEGSKAYAFAFYKDTMAIPHIAQKVLEEKCKRNKLIFQDIIKEGMEMGEIRKGNIDFMAEMLILVIESYSNKKFNKINNREELEIASIELFDFLKYGLLGGVGEK